MTDDQARERARRAAPLSHPGHEAFRRNLTTRLMELRDKQPRRDPSRSTLDRQVAALQAAWDQAHPKARDRFLASLETRSD